MNNDILKNFLRFLLLVPIQVLILNRINFLGYLNPFLYILFILLLPFETPKWMLLIVSFSLGIMIDIFSNTYGLHAAASTLMAFSRPAVLRLITSKKEYEPGLHPGIKDLGFNWFLSYALILVLIHHFALFYLDIFRLSEFFLTFFRVILNTFMTVLVIIISQYLFYRKKQK
jgi:hypothetical protein